VTVKGSERRAVLGRDGPPVQRRERQVRRVGFRNQLGKLDVKVSPYLYISPFFVIFGVVGLYPIIYTAWISLHKWHLLKGDLGFTGLDNFSAVFDQPVFWIALRNTFSIFLIGNLPQFVAAIAIAAVLDANLRMRTFWRMGVLIPYVVTPVAVGLIFSKIFGDQYGLVNVALDAVGLDPVGWHSSTLASHIAIGAMVQWKWTGYNSLIFLAAMQAVPHELYESAVIDGAGRWRQFWSVTIPQIRPTFIFIIVNSTINGLQTFDEPLMFDQRGIGGNNHQWVTITMLIQQVGWREQMDFGRAAAIAWILFLVVVFFGLINFLLSRRIATSDMAPVKKIKGARRGQ
jgi:cellobiose transport system permease protein